MDGLNREIEIKFGTRAPAAFKDARTGTVFSLVSFGSVTVVVKDTEKYPTVDAVKETGSLVALDAFTRAIYELSGTLDALELNRSIDQIRRKMAANMLSSGLEATGIELLELSLSPDSKEKLKILIAAQMTNDHPNPGIVAMGSGMPVPAPAPSPAPKPETSEFPKFCMYCGSKAGSRFCPSCGAKLI